MAAVIPLEGRKDALDHGPLGGTLRVILYSNSGYVPNISSVLGDLTECTFGGYSRQTPSFSAVGDDGVGDAESDAIPVAFIADGSTSQDVYGWALINTATAKIRALDALPSAPFHVANVGDAVTVAMKQFLGVF